MDINKILKDFGRDICIKEPLGWHSNTFKAFIQPLRYKNKMYVEGMPTEIGIMNAGYYLYIGPPNHIFDRLSNEAYIESATEQYKIDRFENIYNGNKIFFVWGVLKERIV